MGTQQSYHTNTAHELVEGYTQLKKQYNGIVYG